LNVLFCTGLRFPFACRAAVALLLGWLAWLPSVSGQELEPRQYTNLPTGLNFAAVVYAYSEGGVATDPTIPLEDAHITVHTGAVAYVHSLAIGHMASKLDVIVPYSSLSGTADFAGQPVSRDISGLNDPRVRLSINFYGAPAVDLKEYAKLKPDFVAGASLQVIPPLGQYDPSRLVNLGTNRWAFKPDIGFSKKIQRLTFDMTLGVALFTDNDNFYGGKYVEQDPVVSTQANVSYDFGKGIWASFGVTYYAGGRTTQDGVEKNNELGNTRAGLTFSFPLNRYYSMKLNVSGGVSVRTGTNFRTYGVGLQYRWGAGI
jgi:hypothetical protein